MADPYFQFKHEIEASLESLSALHSSYLRILRTVPPESHPTSQEVRESQQELRQTLSVLGSDVQELEESVKALLNPHVADRLQISQSQINERRNFVERVKSELKAVQLSLSSTSSDFAQPTPVRPTTSSLIASTSSYRDTPPPPNDDDDDQAAFERQHQTLLLQQQDRTLTDISGTVEMLRQQARMVGHEVVDQNKMLEELDEHVDLTSSRLDRAQRKMNKFIAQNKNSPSSWCILILMIILSVLLFIILFL